MKHRMCRIEDWNGAVYWECSCLKNLDKLIDNFIDSDGIDEE
jgi:hypothetical protein